MKEFDYYPFGMIMPARKYSATDSYRYGFNGIETDNEMVGEGNDYAAFYRHYNPRLGRWFSLDPIERSDYSMYVGFSNNPIKYVDPRGDDDYFDQNGKFLGSDSKKTDRIWITNEKDIKFNKKNQIIAVTQKTEFVDFVNTQMYKNLQEGMRTIMSVGYHYYYDVLKGKAKIFGVKGSDGSEYAAYTSYDDALHIKVNKQSDGKYTLKCAYNSLNDFLIILSHEDDHKKTPKADQIFLTENVEKVFKKGELHPFSHIKQFEAEIKSDYFERTYLHDDHDAQKLAVETVVSYLNWTIYIKDNSNVVYGITTDMIKKKAEEITNLLTQKNSRYSINYNSKTGQYETIKQLPTVTVTAKSSKKSSKKRTN